MFEVDIAQKDLAQGKVIAGGLWYPVRVTSSKLGQSKNSGNPVWKVVCEVLPNKHSEDSEGVALFDTHPLTKNMMWKLVPTLKAFGYEAQKGKQGLDEDAFVNKEVEVYVINELYEGQPQNRIKNYRPWTGTVSK